MFFFTNNNKSSNIPGLRPEAFISEKKKINRRNLAKHVKKEKKKNKRKW